MFALAAVVLVVVWVVSMEIGEIRHHHRLMKRLPEMIADAMDRNREDARLGVRH